MYCAVCYWVSCSPVFSSHLQRLAVKSSRGPLASTQAGRRCDKASLEEPTGRSTCYAFRLNRHPTCTHGAIG
ncbi:uncharacterized protein EI97DRAFT_3381 [Westerdykella ornata]|uniref:Uncharacterized protein n=1 Tax=Westerdykella ornata TaxID=318751 RepID=A0A6A6JXT4_WESOR|nr:uncharacterized protein EI97DRAFT_3381 [Westerdykella ornata]KAF2280628.1 hypothetical protein EI97DRAFT_3381 [Westerdykella ornata]